MRESFAFDPLAMPGIGIEVLTESGVRVSPSSETFPRSLCELSYTCVTDACHQIWPVNGASSHRRSGHSE
jgi:hypothetical protein